MILKKLEEALMEVSAQRNSLDEVEAQLRLMIAKLAGAFPARPSAPSAPLAASRASDSDRSQIDDIADVVRAEGKPMHITSICERLSEMRGSEVLRTKVEPGLNRHIAKTKNPKIAKFAPSTYGLPEWKLERPALINIA